MKKKKARTKGTEWVLVNEKMGKVRNGRQSEMDTEREGKVNKSNSKSRKGSNNIGLPVGRAWTITRQLETFCTCT